MNLCEDCPPWGYCTDKTRCAPCPRRAENRAPGIDLQTGKYSTTQMLMDEMTMGDTNQPLID